MKVYAYKNCSTCRKAIQYLDKTKRDYEEIAIRDTPPSKAELRAMLKVYGGDIRRLFNTSGGDYKEMKLKDKLPGMSQAKAIELLSKNGNLVKRPFVLVGNTGMVGFKEDEWKEKGIRKLPPPLK
jgi:arsenate reductase